MYLFDTNVLSELRNPSTAHEQVWLWANTVHDDDVYISAISLLEIQMGILLSERKDRLKARVFKRWLHEVILPTFTNRLLPINSEISLACATLHVPNPRSERDAFIAATAKVHGLTLVTCNTADFTGMGVHLINPWLP